MTRSTDAQIHIRVSAQFKRAVKVFCAREGITEQQWAHDVLASSLLDQAPDLNVGETTILQSGGRKAPSPRFKVRR